MNWQTNFIVLTNYIAVVIVDTNGVPVDVARHLSLHSQTYFFMLGFQYGLPLSLSLGAVWAVTVATHKWWRPPPI